MAELTLDGFGALPMVRPTSVSEIGSLVTRAGADGLAVYPVGGRTMLHLGCPPTRKGLAVDLCGLDQVVDYPARDMTITVQAGIKVARLQQLLAPENQRLPIDVPQAEDATLGGILATNTCGFRRLGYGTLRDYLLGFSAINDEGQEIKAGGRVVKNVAGYDLCKLYVGSLGTLGIITQATLKLRPLAEEQALVGLAGTAEDVETWMVKLQSSRTRPVCLDLCNDAAARILLERAALPPPTASWLLVVGFEGSSDAVHWQVQQLVRELGPAATLQARVGCTGQSLCRALVEFAALPAYMSLQANLVPSSVVDFCRTTEKLTPRPMLLAHAGNGIVLGHVAEDLTRPQADAILNHWRTQARTTQGSVIVTRCPAEWKTPQFVWGPDREDAWLMREIKARFDPRRLFNPGRFLDGL